MTNIPFLLVRRAIAIAALAGGIIASGPARAWVSFGIAVPPVVVAPAPVAPYPYYPQPYYQQPYYQQPYYPPAYYPPGNNVPPPPPEQSQAPEVTQNQAVYGGTCYAGNYTCPAAPYSQVGTVCTCPGLGAPSYGTVQ